MRSHTSVYGAWLGNHARSTIIKIRFTSLGIAICESRCVGWPGCSAPIIGVVVFDSHQICMWPSRYDNFQEYETLYESIYTLFGSSMEQVRTQIPSHFSIRRRNCWLNGSRHTMLVSQKLASPKVQFHKTFFVISSLLLLFFFFCFGFSLAWIWCWRIDLPLSRIHPQPASELKHTHPHEHKRTTKI